MQEVSSDPLLPISSLLQLILSLDAETFATACFNAKEQVRTIPHYLGPQLAPSNNEINTGGSSNLFVNTLVQPGGDASHRASRAPSLPLSPISLPQAGEFSPQDEEFATVVDPSLPPMSPQQIDKMKENSANKWWFDFITHREIIFPPNTLPDSVVPVKIAVVDTGIDTTNPVILQRWRRKMATSSERYRDFLADDACVAHPAVDRTGYSSREVSEILASLGKGANIEPSDVSGHGTHLAGIVLQLVPDATLFVARVLERNQGDYDIGAAARRVALVCPHRAHGCHSNLKSATNFYHRLS